MNKRLAIGLLAGALAASLAGAVEHPQGSQYDGRIQRVDFNADDVVPVNTGLGLVTTVVFGADESVEHAFAGFSTAVESIWHGNLLFIKPKVPDDSNAKIDASLYETNLVVTTNKHVYNFDLHLVSTDDKALRAGMDAHVTYKIVFHYPDLEAAKSKEKALAKESNAKQDVTNKPQNWNYTMQAGPNAGSITPVMAYDDGRFTFLRFASNRDMPAVFRVADDDTEARLNTHVEHDLNSQSADILVIQQVARQFALRVGTEVVEVYNENYDRMGGLPAYKGVTVPGVQRTIAPEPARATKPIDTVIKPNETQTGNSND